MFLVPILTSINRLVAPIEIIINITINNTDIVIANSNAGNPKTFCIVKQFLRLSFELFCLLGLQHIQNE